MSESPEEQPSTGVLGRIGSWFSPWKGKGPTSPSENASPTKAQVFQPEGEEESEEPVRPLARELQSEEKEPSFNPNSLGLSRDNFPCEEEDATQSAHRGSSVVSSTETAEGGPKGEEFVLSRKKRTGKGKSREESSNGTSVSGNPEKNVSHVRHPSSSSEQGVAYAHIQPEAQQNSQAQTRKTLHVYLEETSVVQCGQNTCDGQEVVRTKTKSLQVPHRAKSQLSRDSPESSSSTSEESIRTDVGPTVREKSYYSAVVGVSLKTHKDCEPEPDQETDSMGRKNVARRKFRKNSQGDGGKSPEEKMPPNAEPAPEGFSASDKSLSSPKTHEGVSSANSSPEHDPTSQPSPEVEESKTSSPDASKQFDNFQDSNFLTAATAAFVVDGFADMDDDDSLYKVERKTETPESKRRSMKVSRSEVKLFTKNVPLKQSSARNNQDFITKDEAKHMPKTEIDSRHQLKKVDEDHKPVAGRIADKISIFERPPERVIKQTFQTPRSADVSPVRRLKTRFVPSDQRSRSAERYDQVESSSASSAREKPISIKERMKNFTEAPKTDTRSDRTALSPLPVMRGTSQKSTSSVAVVASKSQEQDSRDKLDTKVQINTNTESEMTMKPAGRDTAAVGGNVSITKKQPTASKTNDALPSKTIDQSSKPLETSVETKVPAKEEGDSVELISPQTKSPSRTGSRSKKRRSKEPPTSPNVENKPDSTFKPVVTKKVDQVDETAGANSKRLSGTVSLPSDKIKTSTSDEQKNTSNKDLKDTPKENVNSSLKMEKTDKPVSRREPEPPVNKDEPDTAACSSGTKRPFDKDPVILPQKEEKAGDQSLIFSQEKESRESRASTPWLTAKQPIEKQEPPVKHPKLDNELPVQAEQKSKRKLKEPQNTTGQTQQPEHKNTELVSLVVCKDVEKSEKIESEKSSQTEKDDKETMQQLLQLDKNNIKVKVLQESGRVFSGSDVSVASDSERKTPRPLKDKRKPTNMQLEPDSISPPTQTQHVKQTTTALPQPTPAPAVTQTNEEAATDTKCSEDLSKGETATNVPTEFPKKSTESPGAEIESAVVTAEPQPVSVFVEKMRNVADDSHTRGANDVGLNSAKAAAVVEEEVIVKVSNDTPVGKTKQADSMAIKDSNVREPTPVSVGKSDSREEAGQDDGKKHSSVKSMPSEVKISEDILEHTAGLPQCEAPKSTDSRNHCTSLKGAEKTEERPADSSTSISTVSAAEKTADKPLHSSNNDIPPVPNGTISSQPQLDAVKEEPVDINLSQTPKVPTIPEANKLIADSSKPSSMKKLHFPRGLSKGDSPTQQDAPSSWLDVDFPKQKLKALVPKLSSSGSESNLLDTSGDLDDDDFIEKIQRLCAPFSLPPRKHNTLRHPQPPFAMPAIIEARLEKTFDPEEFKFGLRKNKFSTDITPSALAKLQKSEKKSGIKPARASLADRSILLSSLDIHSRFKDKSPDKEGEDVSEEKDDQIKVKSRLEGSCVFSSLTSTSIRGNRVQTQADGSNSGEVSPSEAPQLSPLPSSQPPPSPLPSSQPPPSPTSTAPLKDTPATPSPALSTTEEAQAPGAVVSDSGPPLPSFNDIKLPDYLEKYLPREPAKPVQSTQGQEQVQTKVMQDAVGKMSVDEADLAVKSTPAPPDAALPSFPGSPTSTQLPLPELKQPPAQPGGELSKNKRTAKGFHKRPGKVVLFEKAQFSGQEYEIYRDAADTTSLQLSPLISVKVVRGCWVLYEKPDFQGRSIALEEGSTELVNMWADQGQETEPQGDPPMQIGSIRLAVWDYSIPHIDLFTEPEGHGRVTPCHDDTIEAGSFGIPLNTASIQVHSGVWLVFSDPGFQGIVTVLETGVYPFPETWGFSSPFVGSLRPLKIGGFKVENPNEVKALVYEKPGFEGLCLEIDSEVLSFCESEEGIAADGANFDSEKLKSVGSLKITGGLWVGYSEPGFEGQQHIFEEGEYMDWNDWGGSEQLLSLRPILSDFLSPHLKMFSARDFGERGANIDLAVPVINMEDTGYGTKTQSADVIGGVWVVFEEPGFGGEPYILERGLYGSPEDWGAIQPRVASAMPVVLDGFENTSKFKVQLFSEPGFQGSVLALEDSVATLQDGFSVASCKVLAGNWLAFDGQDFAGRMYVLEVGSYSDLRAMGCVNSSSSVLSLQTVGFEFSLPSITLFERCDLRGKRVILTDGTVNLQPSGCSRVQSVLVEGGMWVLYKEINYRGAQILLKPGEVPDWRKLTGWLKIGSLRPLMQKQVHFRLRNRQTGLMMTVTGDLDDVKLMRIQELEENGGFEQIWFYHNGRLHCKLVEECCLSPSSSVTMAGSRVSLSPGTDDHLWSITPEGFIFYNAENLVLEVKGGKHFDKNLVILNTHDPNKRQQQWDVEII